MSLISFKESLILLTFDAENVSKDEQLIKESAEAWEKEYEKFLDENFKKEMTDKKKKEEEVEEYLKSTCATFPGSSLSKKKKKVFRTRAFIGGQFY